MMLWHYSKVKTNILCICIGEGVASPNGRRKRPEGGREDTKPTTTANTNNSGSPSPSTTSGASCLGQSQNQGGIGPSRRRTPNTKSTTRQQRSGTFNYRMIV